MDRRSSRKTLTEAERDARRQADRDRLEQAARELLTSDGWQRWIRVRATNGLARYSMKNQWILASECARRGITPTYVAGFRAFLALNRCVRKGETAIRILAPVSVKERDAAGEETGEERVFFRTVPVFDVAMTDVLPGTEPVPLAPAPQPIDGDSHAELIVPRQRLGRELGYQVERRELPAGGPQGWCDPRRQEIVVGIGPANREVRTLVHELAHALGLGYAQYGRERAEVLVDCVTYCVLGAVGLDVGGESIPYVAGWGEDGALEAIGGPPRRSRLPQRVLDAQEVHRGAQCQLVELCAGGLVVGPAAVVPRVGQLGDIVPASVARPLAESRRSGPSIAQVDDGVSHPKRPDEMIGRGRRGKKPLGALGRVGCRDVENARRPRAQAAGGQMLRVDARPQRGARNP